jgi:hypothetical protein
MAEGASPRWGRTEPASSALSFGGVREAKNGGRHLGRGHAHSLSRGGARGGPKKQTELRRGEPGEFIRVFSRPSYHEAASKDLSRFEQAWGYDMRCPDRLGRGKSTSTRGRHRGRLVEAIAVRQTPGLRKFGWRGPQGFTLPIARWFATAVSDGVWALRWCARGLFRLQKPIGGMWRGDSGE